MRHRGKNLNRIVKTNLKFQTKEFFSNSTLHGVRYIAEEGRSFGEKLMWFSFVGIGAVAAFVIIASLWEKFQTNPTITGLDTDFHDPVLHFPTVTVCPNDPFNIDAVNETALEQVSEHETAAYGPNFALLQNLTRLSYENLREFVEFSLKNSYIIKPDPTNWGKQSLRKWAFIVAANIDEVFTQCKFREEIKNCSEIFRPVYSERGFCFSFNSRYYGEDEVKNENMLQIFETEKSWSLEINLGVGAMVYLHSVREVFSYDARAQFSYEPENTVDLLISMKETYTTEDANQLSATQRKCIFPSEQKMNFHQEENEEYSLSACMKECRMKRAVSFCKCIPPFYAPQKNSKFPYCTLQNMTCIFTSASNITDITKCSNCELSCDNTVYDIEKFSKANSNPATSTVATVESDRIRIEFLTWPIIRYKREVLFGWVDLLVSFGGIAGLFLGFSLLSGIEIIYYFTVRAGCMMYKNRQQLYEIQREEDARPLIKYDLSLIPKFKRSSMEMANIQIVKPVVEDVINGNSNFFNERTNNARPNSLPMMIERNKNQQHRHDDLLLTTGAANEKIDQPNRAFPSSLLSFNRQIIVDEEESVRRNVNDKQVAHRYNRIFRPIPAAPYARNIVPLDRNFQQRRHSQNQGDSDLVYHGYLP